MNKQPATVMEEDTRLLHQLAGKCVSCGFCNATCPSYAVLGNELDGPRGRIKQIVNLATDDAADPIIHKHLDSCLTCRNCETTCPSGVEFGKIVDLGRTLARQRFGRSVTARCSRHLLALLNYPSIATRAFGFASLMRKILPATVRQSIPVREPLLPLIDTSNCNRKVLLLEGCVQPGLRPNTNRALRNLLARIGIATESPARQLCCGALPHHLDFEESARQLAIRILNSSEQHFNAGCEAVVMTSSACVLALKEFPWLLRNEPSHLAKARAFPVQDISELITPEAIRTLGIRTDAHIAFHPPCTLQHGQGEARVKAVDSLLEAAGLTVIPTADRHQCCGSAGTYSIMQPTVAKELRDTKIANLTAARPDYIATANIGCQVFLQQGLDAHTRVWHWVELIEHLANQANPAYSQNDLGL